MVAKTIHVGHKYPSNKWGAYEVVEELADMRLLIKFERTGFVKNIHRTHVSSGEIKDPMQPSVYGVGYLGDDEPKDGKIVQLWGGMFERVFVRNGYEDCRISKRWHCYRRFEEDVMQMENFNSPDFQFDKDLIVLGNRVYGRKYCSFVPQEINKVLLPGRALTTGLPWGVKRGRPGKFIARIKKENVEHHLGVYDDPQEAHEVFLAAKVKYVRWMAKKYKEVIDPRVYKTLRTLDRAYFKQGT